MAQPDFQLPRHLDHYLGILSKLYGQKAERLLQEIVVNGKPRVHLQISYDNWNGGVSGHAVYLVLQDSLYLSVIEHKNDIEVRLAEDLNRVHSVQDEFFEKVILDSEVIEDTDWRRKSGVLRLGERLVPEAAANRIWADGQFRLFLSHKSEVKIETAALKASLSPFGISAFVAHEDIHATKEWQDEIENALASMDGFVALLTDSFHDSNWTDQEVGYAVARGVPMIAVRLGCDPYGFIGKFQALRCAWDDAHERIVGLLIKHEQMFSSYIQAMKGCRSFDSANVLSRVLPHISSPSDEQVTALVEVYNANVEVRGGFGFNGERQAEYGPGLLRYLKQWTNKSFELDAEFKIPLPA